MRFSVVLIEPHPKDLVESIRELFKSKTGISMSCGIGTNITTSMQNLRLAKLYGKDQIRGLSC